MKNVIIVCVFLFALQQGSTKTPNLNSALQDKLSLAMCQSSCKNQTTEVRKCDIDRCNCSTSFLNKTDFNRPLNGTHLKPPKLKCKQENMAYLIWDAEDDFTYFLEVWSQGKQKNFTELTNCGSFLLKNLDDNTGYKLRLWAVSSERNQFFDSDIVEVETPWRYVSPLPVQEIYLDRLILKDNTYDAVIKWRPNQDLPCFYHLLWHGWEMGDIVEKEIRDPTLPPEVTLSDLEFNSNFTVSIRSERLLMQKDSPQTDLHISIPSCLEAHASLAKCPPAPPSHFVVEENLVSESAEVEDLKYNVVLTWSKPDLLPNYYTASFKNLGTTRAQNDTGQRLTIEGDQTSAVFQNVKLAEHYQIGLTAWSAAGPSEPIVQSRHMTGTQPTAVAKYRSWTVAETILVVIGPLSVILIFVGLLLFIGHYRAKRERTEQRCRYFKELEEKSPEGIDSMAVDLIPDEYHDEWELDPNKLSLHTVLGEGAFGIVRRAYLETNDGNKVEVAIKMLKDSPSSEEVRQFTQEIEIMKSVKKHLHVVSLVGCITRGCPEGPLLVVEYCSRGDLQTYLRTVWDRLINTQKDIEYIDRSSDSFGKYFSNQTYGFHDLESFPHDFLFPPKHLISIAHQVAMGMEHLSKMRVVHRDLAARNVLVCEDRTVKVSDFGLSRDVYQDNVYCKTGGGKLPIRWMALESLTHQRYTTQSDVWSFGVLLWEIVTLGGTPYVGVQSRDLLGLLKNGHRLEKPINCSTELYGIMQNCWKASPKDRPTFTDLRKSLEGLLETVSHYLHLDVTCNDFITCNPNKILSKTQSSERYVKPIVR